MAANEQTASNIVVGNGIGNPYASGGSSNPFANGSPLTGSGGTSTEGKDPFSYIPGGNPFGEGENPFGDGENPFAGGGNPLAGGENPFVINRDTGDNNAAVGTGNWDLSDNNATIGNGNWNTDSATNNATIGNGNWKRGSASNNDTIGNGNWYLKDSSDNSTLGNGNWHFGSDNSTIGNGNWDYGNNNLVIGNGNWLFTDNNVVIGNGNWFLNTDGTTGTVNQNIKTLEALSPEVKEDVNGLVDYLMSRFGNDFVNAGLTSNLDESGAQTFDKLILAQGPDDGKGLSDLSEGDIAQLLGAVSGFSSSSDGNAACFIGCGDRPNQPSSSQPVPEPSSAIPLVALGLAYFFCSKKFKRKATNTYL